MSFQQIAEKAGGPSATRTWAPSSDPRWSPLFGVISAWGACGGWVLNDSARTFGDFAM